MHPRCQISAIVMPRSREEKWKGNGVGAAVAGYLRRFNIDGAQFAEAG